MDRELGFYVMEKIGSVFSGCFKLGGESEGGMEERGPKRCLFYVWLRLLFFKQKRGGTGMNINLLGTNCIEINDDVKRQKKKQRGRHNEREKERERERERDWRVIWG